MVWKDQNEEFVKYMEGIFLTAAPDPDPPDQNGSSLERTDQGFRNRRSGSPSAVRVFRQVYAQGGAGHGLEMKLNTEP
ncbi:hypothetical protein FVEG_16464 [Fusarium verticillioides 7600]|uniref:Uncharacterized protein n=1 Tax=Gibberella moniliformis (strain M3125 / FGSC 7600) TaxID=334819 RepID=W7MNX1_GIBM7|nr:hypothetical protein FVEG_16464 [Fusarium verticillioides 7600]EWG49290.1 hypothetical protein FVEG_16464 [Fusarium verticillioides 7600]